MFPHLVEKASSDTATAFIHLKPTEFLTLDPKSTNISGLKQNAFTMRSKEKEKKKPVRSLYQLRVTGKELNQLDGTLLLENVYHRVFTLICVPK